MPCWTPLSTLSYRGRLVLVVILVLLAAACGSSESEPTDTTAASATSVTEAAITTAAPATTTTTTTPPTTTSTTTTTTTTTQAPATTTTEAPQPFDPLDVAFSVVVDHGHTPATSVFTATGPAVDAGVMCSTGTGFENDREVAEDREHLSFRMVCDELDGSFNLVVDHQGAWDEGKWVASGTWTLANGSSACTGISGEGTETYVFYALEGQVETTGQIWRSGTG